MLKPFIDAKTHTEMVDTVRKSKELFEIDCAIHTKLMGCNDVWELYNNMMIRGHITKIEIPSFFICADDDQIFDNNHMPLEEALSERNKSVIVLRTKRGNHVCHCSGFLAVRQWFVEPAVEYLNFLNSTSFKIKTK